MIDKPEIGAPCNGCGLCCRTRVCSTGSFALRLVRRFGERVDGPCPALEPRPDGSVACGLVAHPRAYLRNHPRPDAALRFAVAVLIGAGAGCDEAGDEPDETAGPKLDALAERHVRDRKADIIAAVEVVHVV